MGDDHGNIFPNKLGGKLCGAITSSLRVADVKHDVVTFRITQALQSVAQRIGKRMWF